MLTVHNFMFHPGKCYWFNKFTGERASAQTNHYLERRYILGWR